MDSNKIYVYQFNEFFASILIVRKLNQSNVIIISTDIEAYKKLS